MVAISYPKTCLRDWRLIQLVFVLLAATLLSSCNGVRAELKKRGVTVDQEQLVEYAAAGDTEIVDLLLQADIPLEGRNSYGTSAMMAASEAGSLEVVKLLLDRGADPNRSANGSWETPLMLATIQGRTQVVRLLIEAGARVDYQDEGTGITPLMNAALEGHREIAADLLSAGADVETADQTGWSALHHAVRKGHSHLALELVAAGADPEQQDVDGFTALALARSRGNWRLVSHLEKLQKDRRRGPQTASAADSPFAAPAGWEVVDPFDGSARFWPQHATFSTHEDPPGSRRVLLRSSPDEEAQIFLILGQAGTWWNLYRDRVQQLEQDPTLEDKIILRVHSLQGVTLDVRRYRLVDTTRAERQSERFLAMGEVGEGRIFVLDAGGNPLADGIDLIESVIRHSRLLDAIGAEQHS